MTANDQTLVAFASPAAAGAAPHVETPVAYDALILASFGGPEGQDDVIPFLRNVTRGRGIPDERLEEVAHHYRHFGGISPINEQNRQLKAALEAEIAARGLDLPVYWGNR
ncbi:MAG: ferrochelatase, partial [Microbacterium sp.]|nr:ferrochelatase [Microbacterium sp.]